MGVGDGVRVTSMTSITIGVEVGAKGSGVGENGTAVEGIVGLGEAGVNAITEAVVGEAGVRVVVNAA